MEPFVLLMLLAVGGGVALGAAAAYFPLRAVSAAREADLRQELQSLTPFRDEALSLRAQTARLEQVEAEWRRLAEENNQIRIESEDRKRTRLNSSHVAIS